MSDPVPDWRSGKICYLELPAADVAVSADFYRRVFGWSTSVRGDGALSFTDTVGEVSGVFVDRPPSAGEPGQLLYVMVADADSAAAAITAAGGRIARSSPEGSPEVWSWFADPAGNLLGIYQQPGLADRERGTQP